MHLYDLLDAAKATGDIICSKGNGMSMRYRKESESFVWCNINGKFYIYEDDNTGYNQVILKPSLFSHQWYLQPFKEEIIGKVIIDVDGLRLEYPDGKIITLEEVCRSALKGYI